MNPMVIILLIIVTVILFLAAGIHINISLLIGLLYLVAIGIAIKIIIYYIEEEQSEPIDAEAFASICFMGCVWPIVLLIFLLIIPGQLINKRRDRILKERSMPVTFNTTEVIEEKEKTLTETITGLVSGD